MSLTSSYKIRIGRTVIDRTYMYISNHTRNIEKLVHSELEREVCDSCYLAAISDIVI